MRYCPKGLILHFRPEYIFDLICQRSHVICLRRISGRIERQPRFIKSPTELRYLPASEREYDGTTATGYNGSQFKDFLCCQNGLDLYH